MLVLSFQDVTDFEQHNMFRIAFPHNFSLPAYTLVVGTALSSREAAGRNTSSQRV